jgi:DNA-binding MarR family transcriptional regulator
MNTMFEGNTTKDHKDTRERLLQQAIEQLFTMMRKVHKEIGPHKQFISPPQARLAFIISSFKEEGISVKDLAERSCITPGAVTQFVDQLIAKGLVKRETDPNDRRIVRLKVTPAAKSRLHKLKKDFYTSASQTFDVLNDDELKQLIDLLAKVNLQKSDV